MIILTIISVLMIAISVLMIAISLVAIIKPGKDELVKYDHIESETHNEE